LPLPTAYRGLCMMNVLWIARTIPLPFDAGDRIYTAELASGLAGAGAKVTFLGLAPEVDTDPGNLSTRVYWQAIPAKPASPISFLLSDLPMVAVRHHVQRFVEAIEACMSQTKWDAVVIDYYSMVWTLDILRKVRYSGLTVYLAHNFETEVSHNIAQAYSGNRLKRFMLGVNSRRIAAAESRLVEAADVIVALTERDRLQFSKAGSKADIVVIPPGYSGARVSSRRIDEAVPRRAIAVGSFEWTAKQINLVKFLELADQRFRDENIELRIIGKIPPALKASLEGKLTATKLVGFVDDLSAEFSSARVALVFDETGGGFKLKMLDYVYSRVPVCGLAHALEGLPPGVLKNALIANDLPQLVDMVASEIDDCTRLDLMQDGAYREIEGAFSWDANGRLFLEALTRASCRGSSRRTA
jgi:polysaccharide biosynthesis protein PslH